jgi:hypothetical protein
VQSLAFYRAATNRHGRAGRSRRTSTDRRFASRRSVGVISVWSPVISSHSGCKHGSASARDRVRQTSTSSLRSVRKGGTLSLAKILMAGRRLCWRLRR